ncbi:MAG: zinc ribbon domain-containing protein [Candidatus Cloacimonas sp.]|jgi:uncharacterized Zn finger protein (UPF0148 family)|nr:zinc ribbon domain-containing protein [Candidatus Cloacimonadota bacterium]
MWCTECGKEVFEGDVFCGSCGAKLSDISENSSSSSQTNDETKAKRVYVGMSEHLNEAAELVRLTLENDRLQTNFIENENEIVVQGQKSSSFLEKAIGLDKAVTVILSIDGEDLIVQIGGAKWMDKAAGATIGLLVFWPTIITAGWGAINQNMLMDKVDKVLLKFLR